MKPISLIHSTSFYNLRFILKSQRLMTGVDMYANGRTFDGYTSGGWSPDQVSDQYPGVYFSVSFDHDIGKEKTYYEDDEVHLVFCTALLNRRDYHWNPVDENGYISSRTYDPDLFEALLLSSDPGRMEDYITTNELVVHHSVPLTFLREIWVQSKSMQSEVMTLMNGSNVKVRVVNNIPDKEYVCMSKIVEQLTPNMCFWFDPYERPSKPDGFNEPMDFYRHLAMQCGLSQEEVNKFDDPSKLNQRLKGVVNKRFLSHSSRSS